jgi:tetratricopeptide (TPR) repeat protein
MQNQQAELVIHLISYTQNHPRCVILNTLYLYVHTHTNTHALQASNLKHQQTQVLLRWSANPASTCNKFAFASRSASKTSIEMFARSACRKVATATAVAKHGTRLLSSQSRARALLPVVASASVRHANGSSARAAAGGAVAAATALAIWTANECLADTPLVDVGLAVADELYDDVKSCSRAELAEAVAALDACFPNNAHVLWRLARAQYDLHEAAKDAPAAERKELLLKGLSIAHDAVKADASVSAAHKWCGILLTSVGDYESTKVRIGNSYTIRDHFAKAAELDPTDPNAQHLLGRWCVAIADISWIERKAASLVFGTPPKSTYQEALEYFERAEKLKPNFWKKNQVMLATCLEKLGRKEEAKAMYTQALSLASRTDEDIEAHKDAEAGAKRVA